MGDPLLAAILVASVVALYTRPRGIREWQTATVGGLVAWALGPLSFRDGVDLRPRGLDVTPAAYARAAFFPTLAALVAATVVASAILA